jgi:hypothetical protein
MFLMASRNDRNILNFLILLQTHNRKTITHEKLYSKWKRLVSYQKLSESEYRNTFEKLVNAFSQEQTKITSRPVIRQISYHKYIIGNLADAMRIKSCYGSKLKVDMSYRNIREYGNLFRLCQFAVISFMVQVLDYCKDAHYDWRLIENVFGLRKAEVRKYFKQTPVTRKIGKIESTETGLDQNIFTLSNVMGWNIQTGFRLVSWTGVKFMDFNGVVDMESIASIVDRLETKTYSIYNGRWNRRLDGITEHGTSHRFVLRRNITGYNYGRKQSRAGFLVKKIVENVNLGQYKNCKNITGKYRNRYIQDATSVTERNLVLEKALKNYNYHYKSAVRSGLLSIQLY